jgi:hypothetical protein
MTVPFFAVGAIVGSCLLLGCSDTPERGPTVVVSGKVTLNGRAFSSASIRFTSPNSGASFSMDLEVDGSYSIEILDVDEGDAYFISFGPVQKTPVNVELDGAGIPKPNSSPPILAKYLEDSTSGLTAKIGSESMQTFDFALQSK